MTQGDAAIVIVTYNSGAEIGPCLDAALAVSHEVVVVDNASSDDTREQVWSRGARLIANPENRGFAAAVNQGFRATTAPFVLLLNPDTVLETGLEPLVEVCCRPGAGIACGKLVGPDGEIQRGFSVRRFPTPAALAFEALLLNRLWPRNPVNWKYRCYDFDYSGMSEVEQPAGAFFMVRREVWERLGGFDEGFHPLWFEDVDFCVRAWSCGYHGYYTPRAVAKHTGGHSLRNISLESRQLYWYGSLLRYASKHFSVWERRGICLAVIVGSIERLLMGIIHQRSLRPLAVQSEIVRLAGRALAGDPRERKQS